MHPAIQHCAKVNRCSAFVENIFSDVSSPVFAQGKQAGALLTNRASYCERKPKPRKDDLVSLSLDTDDIEHVRRGWDGEITKCCITAEALDLRMCAGDRESLGISACSLVG